MSVGRDARMPCTGMVRAARQDGGGDQGKRMRILMRLFAGTVLAWCLPSGSPLGDDATLATSPAIATNVQQFVPALFGIGPGFTTESVDLSGPAGSRGAGADDLQGPGGHRGAGPPHRRLLHRGTRDSHAVSPAHGARPRRFEVHAGACGRGSGPRAVRHRGPGSGTRAAVPLLPVVLERRGTRPRNGV